jgi:hypothetical protein
MVVQVGEKKRDALGAQDLSRISTKRDSHRRNCPPVSRRDRPAENLLMPRWTPSNVLRVATTAVPLAILSLRDGDP